MAIEADGSLKFLWWDYGALAMIAKPLCALGGHKIDRHKVWHDGISYRTKCARCRTALIRERDGWSAFKESIHGDEARAMSPSEAAA